MSGRLREFSMLVAIAAIAAAFSAILTLGNPIADFREAQVASTILLYVEDGIDLFYPKLNVMGDPGYFVLEFPVYQALAAALWGFLGIEEAWGRILSHLFWTAGAFYLYRLCLMFAEKRVALLTFFLFLFAPITLLYSNMIGIEAMSVFLSIMFLYYGARWIREDRLLFFIIALCVATVGFLQKLPNMAPMFLPLAVLKYIHGRNGIKSLFSPLLILLGLVPLAFTLAWQHHADMVNMMSQNSAWYNTKELGAWYFGTLWQRLNPLTYLINFSKSLENALGSFYLGALMLIGLLFARKYPFFFFYLMAYLLAFLVFTNLHYTHVHYMIPFLAPQVFFVAVGIIACWDSFSNSLPEVTLMGARMRRWLLTGIVGLSSVFFVLWSAAYLDMRGFIYNDYDTGIQADIMAKNVPKDGRIMLYWAFGNSGGTWNPALMHLARRRGVFVYLDELEGADIGSLMEKRRCEYLVLAGEFTRLIYTAGKQSNRTFKKQAHLVEYRLDNFKLNLPSGLESKLAGLTAVYLDDRLRIYKRPEIGKSHVSRR